MNFNLPKTGSFTPRKPVLDLTDLEEFIVGREIIQNGVVGYEPHTLSAAIAVHEAVGGREFLDIGANIGVYAWTMKAIFGECVDVQAYEPLPSLAATARRLAADNGLAIDVRAAAVADYAGEATLYVSARSDSSNSLAAGFRKAKSELTVPVTTIDTICVGSKADFAPSLIKIDTESTEPAVLRGGAAYIASHRPWLIVEVLTGRTEADLMVEMRRHGYHSHKITGERLVPVTSIEGDEEHRDWLFSPEPLEDRFQDTYERWRHAFSAERLSYGGA